MLFMVFDLIFYFGGLNSFHVRYGKQSKNNNQCLIFLSSEDETHNIISRI